MASQQDSDHPFHWHYGELDDKNFEIHGHRSILLVVVVFALIVLFTLLCLYAKWACRYRRLAAELSEASRHRSPPASPGLQVTVVVAAAAGLDRDAINGLPVVVLGSSADEAQCSICLCNLAVGEKVKVLPGCNHGFHPECVDEWLKGQSSCPLCRASLSAGAARPPAALV